MIRFIFAISVGMDISELMGSGFHGNDANSSGVMATKHFMDMPEFVIPTMTMYVLFTVVGSAGKKFQINSGDKQDYTTRRLRCKS